MNLLKSPLRRTTAILAGAVIGLAGVAVTAAPAMATHPTVTGSSDCVTDENWTVDWEVTNEWPNDGDITAVKLSPEDGTLTGDIKVGAKVTQGEDFKLTGKQVVPVDVDEVTLEVVVKFDNGHEEGQSGKVSKPTEACTPSEPGTPPGEEPPGEEPGGEEPGLPEIPDFPGDMPTPIFEVDCDSMTVGLDNPENGLEAKLDFKTSKGEERSVKIAPGEANAETFRAEPGFKVTVTFTFTFEGESASEDITIPYEQPEDCAGGGSAGGGPELPVTGAAASGIAGGAALLLVLGGVLFFLARRRKVKFTA